MDAKATVSVRTASTAQNQKGKLAIGPNNETTISDGRISTNLPLIVTFPQLPFNGNPPFLQQ